jgi:hypothetical protein
MIGFETILPFLRPIEHLIRDDSISEIMVNGANCVFIERAGVLQEVPDLILGEKSLMVAVKNIARRLGDDISEQKPILDSRLPDGSRVVAPTALFWEKSEAVKRLICFSSRTPVTPVRSRQFTQVPLNKPSQDSRAAFCKAASNSRIAPPRTTSAIRSTSSSNWNADQELD